MCNYMKATMIWLSGFFMTSLVTVGCRTILFDLPCDPKFKCLCSFTCLFLPILICTLIFGLAFLLAYWFIGKGHFQELKKSQVHLLLFVSSLLGFLVFVFPLLTIVVIYGGFFTLWLLISFFVSLGAIGLAKKI